MYNNNRRRTSDEEEDKGLLWRLPELRLKQFGKVGPAFGFGVGCGVGFGVGLLGGIGFGPGIPGLQVGLGFGSGCGVGLGFGYGVGRGIAFDDNRRYSNVANFPNRSEIGALVDELIENTKKVVESTSKEIQKWRR